MKWLDWTLPTPEANLAADEALLDWGEAQSGAEVLRFWEASRPFVVVGYANEVAAEVDEAACASRGIPILRRCSGGGTVVQGPGCLNYSVVLRITLGGPTRNITSTNQFVMERHALALRAVLGGLISAPRVEGHTDLALEGVKFSGNAQRRKRHCLLFHGTVLLNFDLALVEAVLRMPSRQPDYRQNRPHREFIRNLPADRQTVKRALREAWQADEAFGSPPLAAVDALIQEKYGRPEWHHRRLRPDPR